MQRRHKKKQQLQVHLEEAAKACHIKCVAQKVRKVVKAKTREEAKKRRLAEKENKRKKLEYLQQLQDEVLAKDVTLLESTEGSQVIKTKYKKTTIGDEKK